MAKKYAITRDKFLTTDEVRRLLKVCEDQADLDLLKGRQTWVTRHMLVALALRSGLRVAEIAALKIGDIHLTGKDTYLKVVGKGKQTPGRLLQRLPGQAPEALHRHQGKDLATALRRMTTCSAPGRGSP